MTLTKKTQRFDDNQIKIVNNSVATAEELVSNFYKMSANQWLRLNYDVKTMVDLFPNEVVCGPFAHIIRYEGKRNNSSLGSLTYDFYKICLQDDAILLALNRSNFLKLFPFMLFIVTHELIHIVRFCKFLQSFDVSYEERMIEEGRVHKKTHEVLSPVKISGLKDVLSFYNKRCAPIEDLQSQ